MGGQLKELIVSWCSKMPWAHGNLATPCYVIFSCPLLVESQLTATHLALGWVQEYVSVLWIIRKYDTICYLWRAMDNPGFITMVLGCKDYLGRYQICKETLFQRVTRENAYQKRLQPLGLQRRKGCFHKTTKEYSRPWPFALWPCQNRLRMQRITISCRVYFGL